VQATGLVAKGVPGRPAALYEFVSRQPAWSLRRSRPPATLGLPGLVDPLSSPASKRSH